MGITLRRIVSFAGVSLLATFLVSACGAKPALGLFEEADMVYVVDDADHHDCTTGSAIFSPEFQLTRVGFRWREDGQQLDILLEYGGIDEYKPGTYSTVGFIDKANPVVEISEIHPSSLHSRARIFAGLEWVESGAVQASLWVMDDFANWTEAEIADASERVEVRGNQIRISVSADLLGLWGPADPGILDLKWVVFSGSLDDPESCVEAPSDSPWPLILDVPDTEHF